jgi:Domain of unknown function (DUF4352)
MSYEPPPQRPSFTPPPDPGYAAPDYDQRHGGQTWPQQPYTQQQPPYYPPPQQQQYYPPQQPPKKRRHWVQNTFLGLAGFIVLIVIISVAVNGGSNGTPAAGSGAAPANPVPAAPQVAKIGTPVRDGKFQFTVTSVSHAKSVGDTADGFGDTAQGKYTILHITVTNIGSQPQTMFDSNQYVYDASGRKYDASTSADIDLNSASGSDSVFVNDINPGNTVRGELAFDMPAGHKAVKAVLHDSAFSGGVSVNLR